MAKIQVLLAGSDTKAHEYVGDYVPLFTESAILSIYEMVPDVANRNEGRPIQTLRRVYNRDEWRILDIDGETND